MPHHAMHQHTPKLDTELGSDKASSSIIIAREIGGVAPRGCGQPGPECGTLPEEGTQFLQQIKGMEQGTGKGNCEGSGDLRDI